uniref:ER membrane protein complex subunit 4 n=1 Tax=Heterorhabditis bacteriophora TaxID=37862 RepID=A0A1I7XFR7_HETBA
MSLTQWKLDYSSSSRNVRTSDNSFNPPGFQPNASSVQHHVSIFPIMMVGMMLWRPAKALFAVNATFKPLEVSSSLTFQR